jgi:hypothetical protein
MGYSQQAKEALYIPSHVTLCTLSATSLMSVPFTCPTHTHVAFTRFSMNNAIIDADATQSYPVPDAQCSVA